MKAHELARKLLELPKDFDVVLMYGPEGDDCGTVYSTSTGWYDAVDNWFTPEILEIDTPDERLYRDRQLNECNAVVLWL